MDVIFAILSRESRCAEADWPEASCRSKVGLRRDEAVAGRDAGWQRSRREVSTRALVKRTAQRLRAGGAGGAGPLRT